MKFYQRKNINVAHAHTHTQCDSLLRCCFSFPQSTFVSREYADEVDVPSIYTANI